jgi:uncharacterized protein
MQVYNSRYNFCIDTEGGSVFYNSKTGGTVLIPDEQAAACSSMLLGEKRIYDAVEFDDSVLELFLSNGFLVQSYRNELEEIRERFWTARGITPMVLTITTTMDCNLGCYYCYESRTKDQLQFNQVEQVVQMVDEKFRKSGKRSLHVDWYGGEPLLNVEFIEAASARLQEYCKERNIIYHASVISNGTLWPNDVEAFVARNKVRQVQISFDGMKENHNKRRRYRNKAGFLGENSFDKAAALVDRLVQVAHVDIRFNTDWNNQGDIMPFINFMEERGWLSTRFPAVFQPARISAYTEKSSFIRERELTLDEYDVIRENVRQRLQGKMSVEESEIPDGFPFPRNYVCAALASDSFIVGADKLIYRCGLQVGETAHAVGHLDSKEELPDAKWWNAFDPCSMPSCSKCSFLPICFGGCPKKHLEKDQHALDEQSEYWRKNLPYKVASYVKQVVRPLQVLGKEDQFRIGYD